MQRTHPHTHSHTHNDGCSFKLVVAVCMLTNLKLQMYMSYYAFLQAILSVADSISAGHPKAFLENNLLLVSMATR